MVSAVIDHVEPMENVQRVWLILANVRAVEEENGAALVVGSEALVQCFVPNQDLKASLSECTQLLRRKGFLLIKVEKCVEFDLDEDYPDAPKFVLDDVRKARDRREAITGTFFVAKDSASFQRQPEE